jgi:hypothetical protein
MCLKLLVCQVMNLLLYILIKKLKDNKNLYGIVSKGIHELSEEECLTMFPCIRTGIELILDDILAEEEKQKKAKTFKKFVADTSGKLSKK